ncbi:MAG TPA: hypothetical protein VMW75_21205 [Thermoanaerobaculia bacterium]|nr:hypothetical protein [Thermoanaerobaculia bacterium]
MLETLARLSLSIAVDCDGLVVKGRRSALTPDLKQAIRDHKAELVSLVAADGWPPESLDAERRFGRWHARLYPLIGKTVATPRGAGRLAQVFPERGSVILPDEAVVGVFAPEELRPGVGNSNPRDHG